MSIHVINPDRNSTPLLMKTVESLGFTAVDMDDVHISPEQEKETVQVIKDSELVVTISHGFSALIWEIITNADSVVVFDTRASIVREYLRSLARTEDIPTLLDQSLDKYQNYQEKFQHIYAELQQVSKEIKIVMVDWEKISVARPTELFATQIAA